MEPKHNPPRLTLPVLVFGLVEVRRLQRELELLESSLMQDRLRADKSPPAAAPKVSRLLDSLARENSLNLLHVAERQILINFLRDVAINAPTIHISFAADPTSGFTAKIVAWLRTNIHPHTLLQLGLQPSIAAGCEVRTANHVFDFSLRHRFYAQRAQLQRALAGREEPKP